MIITQYAEHGLCLTYLALCLAALTNAFIPTPKLSLGNLIGTSHYTLTQDAVLSIDIEFFDIGSLTVSMTKARDEIADANAQVDVTDKHTAVSHFDGESFEDGQNRLAGLRDLVKNSLLSGDGPGARKYLGQALHTVQDFYSHSNWIELGNTDVNTDILGLSTGNVIPKPPTTLETCVNCKYSFPGQTVTIGCQDLCKPVGESFLAVIGFLCLNKCGVGDCSTNLDTTELTSGYYSDEEAYYTKPGKWKCSHGGAFDESAEGIEGINKDSNQQLLSPHASLHTPAANVAFQATVQFIREFKNDPDLDTRDLKLLLGVGPCLAFAIDTTGSMDDIIDPVRQEAIQIVQSRVGTEDEPSLYVLSQIQDPIPDGGYVTVATNADDFIAQINALESGGGGDCPEMAMTGIAYALEAADTGGSLFAYTDAAAKDVELAPQVAALAVQKGIKVYQSLFPSECSSTDGFDLVASQSGGQVFVSGDRTDSGDVTSIADSVVRSNSVDILSAEGTVDGDDSGGDASDKKRRSSLPSFSIPVDSGMSQVTFFLTGSTANLTVTPPDGTAADNSSSNVTSVFLEGGTVLTITNPKVGAWTASINGSGNYSLSASGISPLHLSSFNFVSEQGRPGHTGWFPINGSIPTPGSTNLALAQIEGPFSTARFEYRGLDGTPLGSANLTVAPLDSRTMNSSTVSTSNNTFYGNLTVPSTAFVVYAVGIDSAGAAFQRVVPVRFVQAPEGACLATSPVAPYANSTAGATACSYSVASLTLASPTLIATGGSTTGNCTSCFTTSSPTVVVTAGAPTKDISLLSTVRLVLFITGIVFLHVM